MQTPVRIYDTSMNRVAHLENVFDLSYELTLNELWTASFSLPKDDPKAAYVQPFYYAEIFDGTRRVDLFRMMPQEITRNDQAVLQVECEHVLATLIDDVLFQYHQIGNIGVFTNEVIRYVLNRQTNPLWKLVECDFSHQFEYKWENENLLSALFSIPQCFDEDYRWVWDTTTTPWGISLKKLQEGYDTDIQYKKNMRSITKTVDPTNVVTRLYALGYGEGDNQLDIRSVNNDVPYLEKNISTYGVKASVLVDRRYENAESLKAYAQAMLDKLCKPYVAYDVTTMDMSRTSTTAKPFMPGDNVLVRDLEDGINVVMPIVSVKKSDVTGNPFEVELEVANESRDIAGTISDLAERSRISDTYSQGATNLQQIAYADNADASHGLELSFYIPAEMARINKLLLRYTLEPFRAYSKATAGGGARSSTTSSGGSTYQSTGSGGGEYISDSTGSGGGVYETTHGAYVNDTEVEYDVYDNSGSLIGHTAPIYKVLSHEHTVEISPHSHSVSFSIPSHTHSISIGSHSHSFSIPDHTHQIEHGIYQGGSANSAHLVVDGTTVNTTEKEVDIIPYLQKSDDGKITRGSWHTVEIVPNNLTRISANLFIQLFVNSRGRGDY